MSNRIFMVRLLAAQRPADDCPTQVRTVSRLDLARETSDLTRDATGYERAYLWVQYIVVIFFMRFGDKDDGPQATADLRRSGRPRHSFQGCAESAHQPVGLVAADQRSRIRMRVQALRPYRSSPVPDHQRRRAPRRLPRPAGSDEIAWGTH